jgi:Zn-dependent peptidase ImmA (M78 family)/transcriptional regulator with XRE-family HTH domain
MSKTVMAPVNPRVLAWARMESGYGLEEAADKLKLAPGRLAEWESEGTQELPTLRQAEKLAKLYHRPLPVLFLAEPPVVMPLGAEFRRLPGVRSGDESPELRLALRALRRRREIALTLMEENEEEPPRFQLSARLGEDAETVGARLREALGVTLEEQRRWKDPHEAWRTWRDRAERLGLLVFQVPSVPLRQMRGISLLREVLPVVGVNSKDHPLARVFTLLHEMAHLMLRNGGDEKVSMDERRRASDWAGVERFAESVAAATLMPRDAILADVDIMAHKGNAWSDAEVRPLAWRYRVSPVAFMTRLATLKLVSWASYGAWREAWEKQWENRPKPKTKGGPARTDVILSRVGPTYAALVIDSLSRDLITPLVASDALDLKVHHFDGLKSALMYHGEPPPVAELLEG